MKKIKEDQILKEQYVLELMEKNKEIDTLTELQHDALSRLCKFRHNVHVNQTHFFFSEYKNHEKYWNNIRNSEDSNILSEFLCEVGLPEIEFDINPQLYCTDKNYILSGKTYDEAYEEIVEMAEYFNDKIEEYLKEIDNTYGTKYAPSGIRRRIKFPFDWSILNEIQIEEK